MYTHCDYFFGFGSKQIDILSGMQCSNKIPLGSIGAYKAITNTANADVSMDIIFMESFTPKENHFFNQKVYDQVISHLCALKKEMPELKIYYRYHPGIRANIEAKDIDYFHQLDSKLEQNNIITDPSIYPDSYVAIKHASLVVFYNSTIGIEALALNKRVLCCNYLRVPYLISDSAEMGVLVDSSYKVFKERVMYLLSSKSSEIDQYYINMRKDWMNLTNDPGELIVKTILN